jgi:hypothetical protein
MKSVTAIKLGSFRSVGELAGRSCSPSPTASRSVSRGPPAADRPRTDPGDPGAAYLATVLLLAGFVGRAGAPKAIGQRYVKER